MGFANAQSAKPNSALPTIKPRTNKSFGALKQIDAGELNIGYAEAGPCEWSCRHPAAWLALRHLQLC